MYISYELYRAKNDKKFNAETIEWVLKDDKDMIELDDRLNILLTKHISELDEIKRYGIGYVSRMKIISIIINPDDYTGELDEKNFMEYLKNANMLTNIPVYWNKNGSKDIFENK